jgi:hypothetical protein
MPDCHCPGGGGFKSVCGPLPVASLESWLLVHFLQSRRGFTIIFNHNLAKTWGDCQCHHSTKNDDEFIQNILPQAHSHGATGIRVKDCQMCHWQCMPYGVAIRAWACIARGLSPFVWWEILEGVHTGSRSQVKPQCDGLREMITGFTSNKGKHRNKNLSSDVGHRFLAQTALNFITTTRSR